MTKNQTINLLYDYTVGKTNFPALAKTYGTSADSLKEIVRHSGFNRKTGFLFSAKDCGAYATLCEPKFPASEIKQHLGEYIEDTDRPDMPFREYLSYKGINASNGTRGVPKPMPKKVWHTAQSTAINIAKVKEKNEPLDKSTAVGLIILIIFVVLAIGVGIFLITRGEGSLALTYFS
jgi:hypothetical protein